MYTFVIVAIVIIGYVWYSKPAFLMEFFRAPSEAEGSSKDLDWVNTSMAKTLLRISNVIFGVLLTPACFLAFAGLFLADINYPNLPEWILVLGFISLTSSPFVIVYISLRLSRFIYKKQHYYLAVIVSLAPLLNIGGYFLFKTLMCPYSSQFCKGWLF